MRYQPQGCCAEMARPCRAAVAPLFQGKQEKLGCFGVGAAGGAPCLAHSGVRPFRTPSNPMQCTTILPRPCSFRLSTVHAYAVRSHLPRSQLFARTSPETCDQTRVYSLIVISGLLPAHHVGAGPERWSVGPRSVSPGGDASGWHTAHGSLPLPPPQVAARQVTVKIQSF